MPDDLFTFCSLKEIQSAILHYSLMDELPNIKIILNNLNAKIGTEIQYQEYVGQINS